MNLINSFVYNPVKVTVGVLLIALFGVIALFKMPMQLTPEVERPTISIATTWPGASPAEIEKEIIQRQEEMLQSVEGVTKLSSQSQESSGSITLEFRVGTNMDEALLKVNSQLQQVREYPVDADEPVIRTSSSSDSAIAWFILSAKPATTEQIQEYQEKYPELREDLQRVIDSGNPGLATLRMRRLAEEHPELEPLLPADIDITRLRKFSQDQIEARFERVPGVANSDVRGGREPEVQVIVDPKRCAARGLTLNDIRDALRAYNKDTSAGDLWEGKRRYVVRTLGQFEDIKEIEDVVLASENGRPVFVRDVAEVRRDYKKPDGFVRRFGTSNIAINVQREVGANVLDVMEGLRKVNEDLNKDLLATRGLTLTQVYDETEYINSAVGLVNQNIIVGSALTVIVLMIFLHVSFRTLVFVPFLAASAIAAVVVSPWFFAVTLLLILIAGVWFARGTLVVALAIPTSIVGTFLLLGAMQRSLNVISLAGLAFAVGMLVDNAVVVLENIYRHYQLGKTPLKAAVIGTQEVWGAVLASTLTTLAVFIPVFFLEGEAGQLFVDIALAISCAVGLSLLVSVIVIPTASSRVLRGSETKEEAEQHESSRRVLNVGRWFVGGVVGLNRMVQASWTSRIVTIVLLLAATAWVSWIMRPKVEYLPSGNRNLVICLILPPPGYNLNELGQIGSEVETILQPYWDIEPGSEQLEELEYPAIGDFFYVAAGRQIFLGLRADDPAKARKLIDLVQAKLNGAFPGTFVVSFQTSLFERGLAGGRTIDIEISGPELEKLVGIGGQIMGQTAGVMPETAQLRPVPSLDLSSPELHIRPYDVKAKELGISNDELGYAVNALIDGAYVGDFFEGGDRIDLVIIGSETFNGQTQDLQSKYIATPLMREPVRLGSIADVRLGSGPEQINHRERKRSITIQVTPPEDMPLEVAVDLIESDVLGPLRASGQLGTEYSVFMSGTADKLNETWLALRFNIILAILITYLLMAALFESFLYPFVIIFSVPLGAVGGIVGLKGLGWYLQLQGEPPQTLDVLTMLGFVILVGTVVNNAILIVHQTLNLIREEGLDSKEALLESIRTRIRPIFMTTTTTVFGLSPLVFFPGAGSELYRGLGAVVLGGLVVSTIFTLILVPTLFSLFMDIKVILANMLGFNTQDAPELATAGGGTTATTATPQNSNSTANEQADQGSQSRPAHASVSNGNGTNGSSSNGNGAHPQHDSSTQDSTTNPETSSKDS